MWVAFKAMGTGHDYQKRPYKCRKEIQGLSPQAKLTGWKEDKSKKKKNDKEELKDREEHQEIA